MLRFLADESCDFAVVRALRAADHDVVAVSKTAPGATDETVIALALDERRILLTESALMLSAGCLTGAVAGLCGEVAIDAYLKRTTGFPVAHMTAGAGLRALEILALMLVTVLAITAWPTWLTSRVSPTLMLND